MLEKCPICGTHPVSSNENGFVTFVGCRRCGKFQINDLALFNRDAIFSKDKEASNKVSYSLRKIIKNDPQYLLTAESLLALVSQTSLPTPPEQLDNLIYYLGETSSDAGQGVTLEEKHISILGAKSMNNVGFIAESALKRCLIDGEVRRHANNRDYGGLHSIKLTLDGWSTYLELKRGKTKSNQAFMAMKFGEKELDDIYLNYFKPAVRNTGFELQRLDEGQQAGLIDDQLRVQIRKSKFLIADLTHHNNGAYWEAGYAEGLGKPVIYTCEKSVFDNKDRSTHFDTNHHLTVTWEHGKLEEAVKQLKATIRATLPDEAKMEDLEIGG